MSPRVTLGLSLLLAAPFAVGCDDEPTAPSPPAETVEPPTEEAPETAAIPEPTPAQALMHGHYRRASDARESLIRGDIEQARGDMQWLATHHEGDALPEALQPRLASMQTDAAAFAEATTLTEAGQALARTLVRCGECHEASGGGFHVALPPLPEGETTAAHMQRHRWAAERMWEGLVTADVEQYTAGTDALREVALHENALPSSEEQPPERVAALATHVHELGAEASDATDWAGRASVYGRYLATCAACHRLLHTGPAAPPQPTLEEE
ncbi:MAG: hypothetical protein H6719_35175 [Sandaracinaceae bacterium]|nr:hypothetical protein [Sandaracinaceae bacterium]